MCPKKWVNPVCYNRQCGHGQVVNINTMSCLFPGFLACARPQRNYLGIDQGPILLQAANHRSGFVWQVMREIPAIQLGLCRAGFTGGWLAAGASAPSG